jgi:hypothetical protein
VERNDAAGADEEGDVGLLEPAFGFGLFEFEFLDGLDGVAGDEEFGVVWIEFVGGVYGAGEGAICFAVETSGHSADGAGEKHVVRGVGGGEGQASFYGGELG